MADAPVLLITGASSGIGAETARHAVAGGRRVVLSGRNVAALSALAADFESQERLVAAGIAAFGRIDAAFANAGFGAKRGFLEETPEHWRDMVLTNVLGAAYTIRATLPALLESEGHLLLTSSVAGRRALPGSLYSATKFSVTAMGEALRQEVDGKIRVTLIEPGMVDTPFFDQPPTHALQPADIARAVLYALDQPKHVDVNEILIRPTTQPL
jgi:NADP-dependent 3-hydroxy acid dehydrogenase YdfG